MGVFREFEVWSITFEVVLLVAILCDILYRYMPKMYSNTSQELFPWFTLFYVLMVLVGDWYYHSRLLKWHCNMMTSSNGNLFRVTGLLYGIFTGHPWLPLTKASDAELWCFFYLSPNKRLDKQSRHRWFETPLSSLWRHSNENTFDAVDILYSTCHKSIASITGYL